VQTNTILAPTVTNSHPRSMAWYGTTIRVWYQCIHGTLPVAADTVLFGWLPPTPNVPGAQLLVLYSAISPNTTALLSYSILRYCYEVCAGAMTMEAWRLVRLTFPRALD